ncbi:hypothetical protein HDV05_002228 [Chytridiales sp. JEL 0842]|nr:hypothetical protein HDV05_002228 [Chytridiales sp. JEL 0842]
MGGGGLQILQHKSWHVYSTKNREKVRKDEEAARIEEEKKRQRVVGAEQEHRLSVLRSKKRRHIESDDDQLSLKNPSSKEERFSLFEKPEKEEQSVKESDERHGNDGKYQATVRYNNSLGGDTKVPWYAKPVEEKKDASDEERPRKSSSKPNKPKSSKSKKHAKKSVEQLRQDRIAREAAERAKADKLLYGSNQPSKSADERGLPYFSAFNPGWVKRR